MADPLVEAFATPPTGPERWGRGIAGALVGTRAGAEKVMREIAADDWAISPYRRWMAGLVGGKAGDYNIKLDEAEKDYIELDNKYKKLKKNRGKTIVIEKKGKSERKMAEDLEAKLNDKQIKLIRELGGDPDDVTGTPRDIKWAGVLKQAGISEKHKILNAKIGKLSTVPTIIKEEPIPVTEDEIEEADSLMSTARSKYKKLLRGFNEAIAKKTDLEKMVRLRFQIDPRRGYGQREDTTELRRRLDIKDEINKSIKFLEENYSDVPIKIGVREGEDIEVPLVKFLPVIKSIADKITNMGISSIEAERFAKGAYERLSEISDFNTETIEKKGLIVGNLFRMLTLKDPLIEKKLTVATIPSERVQEAYGFNPLAPDIKVPTPKIKAPILKTTRGIFETPEEKMRRLRKKLEARTKQK